MDLGELSNFIIEGNVKGAEEWTRTALSEGADPLTIVNQGLLPGMDVVGEKFKAYEYYLPDLLVSAKAMKTAMALLHPLMTERKSAGMGKVVIGTVMGDRHDVGKNLVAMLLEGAGFDVVDLGIDVSPDTFVKAVREEKPRIVCLSALLTVTMPMMKTVIDRLAEEGLRGQVKVLVGGAPVTPSYASQIGADATAPEAVSAVEQVKALLGVAAERQGLAEVRIKRRGPGE